MLNFQYHPKDIVLFIEAEKLRRESWVASEQTKFDAATRIQGTPDHTRHIGGNWQSTVQRPAPYDFKSYSQYDQSFVATLKLMCERLSSNIVVAPTDLWKLVMVTGALDVKDGYLKQVSLHHIEANISPIYVIHEILKKCRDLPDADRWPEIQFIKKKDKILWGRLSYALSDAQDALAKGQFRAATVVSFHVLESLLGYWLRNKTPTFSWPKDKHQNDANLTVTKIIEHCKTEGLFQPAVAVLPIDASEILNLEQACLTSASYRNLIHPDKTQRTNTDHDAGTAHSCLGTTLKLAQRIGQVL